MAACRGCIGDSHYLHNAAELHDCQALVRFPPTRAGECEIRNSEKQPTQQCRGCEKSSLIEQAVEPANRRVAGNPNVRRWIGPSRQSLGLVSCGKLWRDCGEIVEPVLAVASYRILFGRTGRDKGAVACTLRMLAGFRRSMWLRLALMLGMRANLARCECRTWAPDTAEGSCRDQ